MSPRSTAKFVNSRSVAPKTTVSASVGMTTDQNATVSRSRYPGSATCASRSMKRPKKRKEKRTTTSVTSVDRKVAAISWLNLNDQTKLNQLETTRWRLRLSTASAALASSKKEPVISERLRSVWVKRLRRVSVIWSPSSLARIEIVSARPVSVLMTLRSCVKRERCALVSAGSSGSSGPGGAPRRSRRDFTSVSRGLRLTPTSIILRDRSSSWSLRSISLVSSLASSWTWLWIVVSLRSAASSSSCADCTVGERSMSTRGSCAAAAPAKTSSVASITNRITSTP